MDGVGLSLWALTFSTRSCQTENEPWQKPHSSHHCFITSWPSSTVLLVTWWMIEFESVNKFFETSPYQIFFRWRSQFRKRCGLPPLVFLWVPSHGLKIAVDFVTLMRRALWDFRGVPKVYLFVISNGYVYATVCVCGSSLWEKWSGVGRGGGLHYTLEGSLTARTPEPSVLSCPCLSQWIWKTVLTYIYMCSESKCLAQQKIIVIHYVEGITHSFQHFNAWKHVWSVMSVCGTRLLCELVIFNSVVQHSAAANSMWSLFLAQLLNAYSMSALECASADAHSQEHLHCACVRACAQWSRSWLKFINFLLANEVACAFFLLTNGRDRGVGGGCCLATAGRISDHVGPIVLSRFPGRHYMLCLGISRGRGGHICQMRHKVVHAIFAW